MNRKRIIQEFNISLIVFFLLLINKPKCKEKIMFFKNKGLLKKLEEYCKNKIGSVGKQYRNIFPPLIDSKIIDKNFNIIDKNIYKKILNEDIDGIYSIIKRKIYFYDGKYKFPNKISVIKYENLYPKYVKHLKNVNIRANKIVNGKVDTRSYNPLSKILQSFERGIHLEKGIFAIGKNCFSFEEIAIEKNGEKNWISKDDIFSYFNDKNMRNNYYQSKNNLNEIILFIKNYISKNQVKKYKKERSDFKTINKNAKALTYWAIGISTHMIDTIINKHNILESNKSNGMYINSLKNKLNIDKNFLDVLKIKFNGVSIHLLEEAFKKILQPKILNKILNNKKNQQNEIFESSELNINESFVSKMGKKNKIGLTALDGKIARSKAEKTGKAAEKTAKDFIFKITIEKIKEYYNEFNESELEILTSEENDDLGADRILKYKSLAYLYEVKKVESTKSLSFKITTNQIKKAINNENYFFVFVDKNNKINYIRGRELLNYLELNPITFSASSRQEVNYRNVTKVIKLFNLKS